MSSRQTIESNKTPKNGIDMHITTPALKVEKLSAHFEQH